MKHLQAHEQARYTATRQQTIHVQNRHGSTQEVILKAGDVMRNVNGIITVKRK